MPTTNLAQHLQQLQRTIPVSQRQAQRLAGLHDKLQQQRCIIAFCGHFSAGKSTLINQLAGSPVLPASPVPTSANQVLIHHGQRAALIRRLDGAEVRLDPFDPDALARLCADGDVASVTIQHPLAHVPEGLWLMDTPGIDSTDEAHRIVTESALYQADAVFYVMDYNHVQSAANLQFARAVAEWGKPLYLVVNQIDKHVELELPFATFRRSVADAFAAWDVQPAGLFFISLREPAHPHNEWAALLATLDRLAQEREALLTAGVWDSAAHVMAEEERAEGQSALLQRLQAAAEAGGDDPQSRREALATELERLAGLPTEAMADLVCAVESLLANAPLFPFPTRELVERYLEARRPGFRVGLLFAAEKSRAEVQRRLAALHADLAQKVQSQIDWHLQQLLLRFGESQAGRDEAYEAAVRAFALPLTPDMLADLVKTGATAREYRHTYIADVAGAIQLRYRKALKPLLDWAARLADERSARDVSPLQAEAARLDAAIAARVELAAMAEKVRTFHAAWAAILGPRPTVGLSTDRTAESPAPETASPAPSVAPVMAPASPTTAAAAPTAGEAYRTAAAHRLAAAADLLAPLPGMALTAADLSQRGDRLANSRFTVALFGAFSAGKSTLINALIGMPLLPASPNPTTAVITQIMPPTAERPHGHLHVYWKSAEQLRHDVDRSLEALGLKSTADIAADLAAARRHAKEAATPGTRPHAAFLAAAAGGYAAAGDKLGRAEAVPLAQLAHLVADEERACFLQEVRLYVDCPSTRQGITLIDTPGADSLNARHTDVAFDYIKNADAILFATYYNHAFARADREFLTQLGRVKDSFQLDKMFFLINAADLATSPDELALVEAHVRANLQACGIREARLFPVSSQTALWSRLLGAGLLPPNLAGRLAQRLGLAVDSPEAVATGLQRSGFEGFEAAFYQFIGGDLSRMAVESGLGEIRRSVATINQWLAVARADDQTRSSLLQEARLAAERADAALAAVDATPEAGEVERELAELLYYVRRRVLHERFRDHYALAFNPSALRSDNPDLRGALRTALAEVLESVAFDLSQEIRATALRLENAANRQAERFAERAGGAIARKLAGWECPPYTREALPMPPVAEGGVYLRAEAAAFVRLLSLFRSPEQFFAGGGRDRLGDELAAALAGPVDAYLADARRTLAEWYGVAFQRQVAAVRAQLGEGIAEQLRGLNAALTASGEAVRLQEVLAKLQELLHAG
ncbi:MAG: dynamin family protein [Mycobacterium leprae]